MADSLAYVAYVFGFGTQVLQFSLAECRHLLCHDVEEARASLFAPLV